MTEKDNWEKWLSDNSLTTLVVIFLVAVLSVAVVIGFYVVSFRGIASAATWGQVGDFFGGTLNPIFGFLSVMALLAALVIQGRELKVSSEELRNSALALNAQNKAIAHQSFEQTFFSWLKGYSDMLGTISQTVSRTVVTGTDHRGRIALRDWLNSDLSIHSVLRAIECDTDFAHSNTVAFAELCKDQPSSITHGAMCAWDELYKENEYQLDSLFRNLYRLILWIDSQGDDRISIAQKWLYVSIVRAQISWIEMAYLFYNGYTERGMKFRRLAEKYALFDNMNFESDPVIAHVRKYSPEDMRYADTAYDSCLARTNLGLPGATEDTLAMAVV